MNLEDLYRLLRSEHVQAQGIVDTLEEPLLVIDQGGCVLTANRGFYETFRVGRDDTVGRGLFDLGDGQWDIPELRRLVGEIIPRSAAVVGYEVAADFPTIGQRTMLVSARRLVHPDNNSTSVLILFEDVTDRRHIEAQKDILLAETRHRMNNLLGIIRSLANQGDVEGRSAKDYRDAFLGRLQAVTEAETFALAGSAETDLGTLVEQSLKAAGPDRYRVIAGPANRLCHQPLITGSRRTSESADLLRLAATRRELAFGPEHPSNPTHSFSRLTCLNPQTGKTRLECDFP